MFEFAKWLHVTAMMIGFGGAPVGRLILRFLMWRIPERDTAMRILSAFSAIFVLASVSAAVGVCAGLYLAFSVGMTEFWLLLSYGLLFVAGILGIFVDERWAHKLREASPENFAAVRAQWVPFVSTLLGPVLWLAILWLMISKPG